MTDEHDDLFEDNDDEETSAIDDVDFISKIDLLLAERRPDRYEPKGGDEWLHQIAREVAPLLPEARIREIHAYSEVKKRERTKTSRTNNLLRDIAKSGQLVLDWFDYQSMPLAVGKERVALRAVTPDDLREFATVERRRILNDVTQRNAACEGAEWLAELMKARGWHHGKDITTDPPDDVDEADTED